MLTWRGPERHSTHACCPTDVWPSQRAVLGMFSLAGRGAGLARLARPPAALRVPPPHRASARRAFAPAAAGTDTRFRIPGREVPDEAILTIDDAEIEQRRDSGHASRLVQVRHVSADGCCAAPSRLAARTRCCARCCAR